MSTSVEKAKQLAGLLKQIQELSVAAMAIAEEMPTKADFNFISDFKEAYGKGLSKVTLTTDNVNIELRLLEDILYLREVESINPKIAEWKQYIHPTSKLLSPHGMDMLRAVLGIDSSARLARVVEHYIKDPW